MILIYFALIILIGIFLGIGLGKLTNWLVGEDVWKL